MSEPVNLSDFRRHDVNGEWAKGYRACALDARTAAFGAIRRAVVYARGDEIDANYMKATGQPGWIQAQWRADEVRQIIRAAIGSEKA